MSVGGSLSVWLDEVDSEVCLTCRCFNGGVELFRLFTVMVDFMRVTTTDTYTLP
jgi:hypothetical protein